MIYYKKASQPQVFVDLIKAKQIELGNKAIFLLSLWSFLYKNTAKALRRIVDRSHVYIWKWSQKYKPNKISTKRKKIDEFIIDETLIRIGSQYVRLWVAIEPKNKQILQVDISFDKTMLIVAERFIAS